MRSLTPSAMHPTPPSSCSTSMLLHPAPLAPPFHRRCSMHRRAPVLHASPSPDGSPSGLIPAAPSAPPRPSPGAPRGPHTLPSSYQSVWSLVPHTPSGPRGQARGTDPSPTPRPASTSPAGTAAAGGGAGGGWTFDDAAEQQDIQALYRLEQSRLYRHRSRSGESVDVRDSGTAVITQIPGQLRSDVLSNALLLVDKPQDWSDDEVIRALLPAMRLHPAPPPPKQRSSPGAAAPQPTTSQPTISQPTISQPSSLELMASGLLVLCLGAASRLTPSFHPLDKVYSGVLRLGASTDTWDAWGRPVEELPWEHVTDASIEAASQNLEGEVLLVAPQYAAERVGGRRFIRPINEGESSQPEVQAVRISRFSAWRERDSRDISFEITCTQPQFIRSVVHTLGRSLDTAAHLVSLRREALGPFSVQDAWPLDVLLPLLKRYRDMNRKRRRRRD